MAEIAVVGITDRGPDSLLPEAHALVAQATLLCGGERHLAFYPNHLAERFVIRANIGELVERLRQATGSVVVLASGDPDWYGIGPLLAEQLGRERVRILPNLSSVQLAFARLGLSWHDAVHLSAHGRPLDTILPAALVAPTAVILTDDRNTPSIIARALLDAGDEDAPADVFEHVGGSRERHVDGTLSDFVSQSFAPLNLLIVRHRRAPRPWPLGLPEDAFSHRGGMITKAEVRVVSLAKLRLHERAVLWDVGAGCGSVAIEAASLLRHGRVYAIERDPEQTAFLAENRRRFGAGNVVVAAAEAPAALADLPDPDAVFVGGSGGELAAILRMAMKRLRPGGRIVANVIGLEHLGQIVGEERNPAWSVEVIQVSVARSTPTAGLTRLAALNPVFVVALGRADEETSA
ncbi:MAG TPA: precorrin-6y C5,15-methyltransferase (decarboxylating) subunit CbiE [Candidatus Saccharimonadales bacterium]|nr:precorrin-6y C5,15-methyltransferase (decarboxylating) subunit CbiE [Candidatus Saccharimonadales bacterium]HVC35307.1 precorrin-6y C5,15-methyltransferase (decarboxylating) subunit CbiE [Chloroflexota bacterium]